MIAAKLLMIALMKYKMLMVVMLSQGNQLRKQAAGYSTQTSPHCCGREGHGRVGRAGLVGVRKR